MSPLSHPAVSQLESPGRHGVRRDGRGPVQCGYTQSHPSPPSRVGCWGRRVTGRFSGAAAQCVNDGSPMLGRHRGPFCNRRGRWGKGRGCKRSSCGGPSNAPGILPTAFDYFRPQIRGLFLGVCLATSRRRGPCLSPARASRSPIVPAKSWRSDEARRIAANIASCLI